MVNRGGQVNMALWDKRDENQVNRLVGSGRRMVLGCRRRHACGLGRLAGLSSRWVATATEPWASAIVSAVTGHG